MGSSWSLLFIAWSASVWGFFVSSSAAVAFLGFCGCFRVWLGGGGVAEDRGKFVALGLASVLWRVFGVGDPAVSEGEVCHGFRDL